MTIDIDRAHSLRRMRRFYRTMMCACAFAFGMNVTGYAWFGDITLGVLAAMFLVESVETTNRLLELDAIDRRDVR